MAWPTKRVWSGGTEDLWVMRWTSGVVVVRIVQGTPGQGMFPTNAVPAVPDDSGAFRAVSLARSLAPASVRMHARPLRPEYVLA